MIKPQQLSKASGFFFLLSFIISKLQYLPFPMLSATFSLISLGLSFAGYGSWFTSSLLELDTERPRKTWYDFLKTQEYFMTASSIGIIGTVLNVAAVFVPIIFPAAAWLFFLGHIFWISGEYHKLKNPPEDKSFCKQKQQAKIDYALTTAIMGLVTAVAATLMVLFPPLIIPITVFSVLISVGLGILALDFFLKMITTYKKPEEPQNSYLKMEEQLGSSPSLELEVGAKPGHEKSLFPKAQRPAEHHGHDQGLVFFKKEAAPL